jgi:hypothetical protein
LPSGKLLPGALLPGLRSGRLCAGLLRKGLLCARLLRKGLLLQRTLLQRTLPQSS